MSPRRATPPLALAAMICVAGCSTPRSADAPPDPGTPDSPIARPTDVTHASTSRAVFALRPVGVVPFAGPMLPLSSPKGDFLAVPVGTPAPWPAVLADTVPGSGDPPAAVDPSSRIRAYALKPGAAVELTWSSSLPRGLVLGRSCDGAGFLVEAPQPDGSRRIGKVSWADGHVEWLVTDGAINAHGALGPRGALAYTSRPIAGGPAEIVVLQNGAAPIRIPPPENASFFAPWFARGHIAALLLSGEGTQLVTMPLSSGPPMFATRRTLARGNPTAGVAFQILASQQVGPVLGEHVDGAVFDPSLGGMVAVGDSGSSSPLERDSVGAARTTKLPGEGWLLTTPEGLIYRPLEAIAANRQDRVRISDAPFLPRLTVEQGHFLLLGPNRSGVVPSLQILMLNTAPPVAVPAKGPETGSGI